MARGITARGGANRTAAGAALAPGTADLDRLASWLDTRWSVFGIRFGVDPFLSLLPGVGDLASFGISTYLIGHAWRMGARKRVLARMLGNAAAESVVGSIPGIGTVISVFWKANKANMRLLRDELARQGR